MERIMSDHVKKTIRYSGIESILDRIEALLFQLEPDELVSFALNNRNAFEQNNSKPNHEIENTDVYSALVNISPVPIEYEELSKNSLGYISFTENRIVIQKNMPIARTNETILLLVTKWMIYHGENEYKDSHSLDVLGEGVTYVVAKHFDMKVSDFLLSDYEWDKQEGEKSVLYLKTIADVSKNIIAKINNYISQMYPYKVNDTKIGFVIQPDLFSFEGGYLNSEDDIVSEDEPVKKATRRK